MLTFIFINGKGSSGKDTQAELILENNPEKAIRISTGDIYRGAKSKEGTFGKYFDDVQPYIQHVDNGGFLPDNVIVGIVEKQVNEYIQDGKETFIFTGFPRTCPQLDMVDAMLTKFNNPEIKFIYYQLSDEISQTRAKTRREKAEATCQPIRPDDCENVISRRLLVFRELTEPMLTQLQTEGRLQTIDASSTIKNIAVETKRRLSKERN